MELAHSDGLKILMGKLYFSVRNFGYVTRLERRDGVKFAYTLLDICKSAVASYMTSAGNYCMRNIGNTV